MHNTLFFHLSIAVPTLHPSKHLFHNQKQIYGLQSTHSFGFSQSAQKFESEIAQTGRQTNPEIPEFAQLYTDSHCTL